MGGFVLRRNYLEAFLAPADDYVDKSAHINAIDRYRNILN
jgi:hypothetical protein